MAQITGSTIAGPPVVRLLRHAYRTAREILAHRPVAGRRWRRPARQCPGWCAGGHHCTAQHGYPGGEHRSPVTTWAPPYGALIATRVQRIDGPPRLELRVQVNLDDHDDGLALAQGMHTPIVVDLAVRTVLAELAAESKRIDQLAGPR